MMINSTEQACEPLREGKWILGSISFLAEDQWTQMARMAWRTHKKREEEEMGLPVSRSCVAKRTGA